MIRWTPLLLICACTLSAQTKKILVAGGEEDLVRDLQSVSPKARIVPVTDSNVMQEIGDADAFVGGITPAEVRAGKRLKWVAGDERGRRGRAVYVRRQRFAR